jgi:hypothetical protein
MGRFSSRMLSSLARLKSGAGPAKPQADAALLPVGMNRRGALAAFATAACGLALPEMALAVGPSQPDGSEQARANAEQAIPFDKLKPETRAKLLSVVDRPTLYRRLPIQSIDCDHDLHVFLVRYPEVVVNIWQLMGISNIQAKRTADFTIEGSDGAGTTSKIDLVYGTPDLHLFFCEGSYEGPLFRRLLTGRSVLLLRSGYSFDRAKRPIVTNQLDVFLAVDNAGAEFLTKTLHSTVGKTIDSNFTETTKFLTRVSDAAERNGPGMQNLAAKLNNCNEDVRRGFVDVSTGVGPRHAERIAALTNPLQVQPDGRITQPASTALPQRR